MPRRPSSLALIVILVLAVVGSSGVASAHPYRAPDLAGITLAASVTSTPSLPACRYLDIMTRFRALSNWRKSLVDTRLRVGSKYRPNDLVSVGQANIGGSGMVRRIMIDDLKAMARAARTAGKGIAVRSAYRSYTAQKSVFASWVNRSGYQQALKSARDPGTRNTSWVRPSTSGVPRARRHPGTTTTGRPAGRVPGCRRTPGSTASS